MDRESRALKYRGRGEIGCFPDSRRMGDGVDGRMETARWQPRGKIVSLEERGDRFGMAFDGGLCSKRRNFRIHYHVAGGELPGW